MQPPWNNLEIALYGHSLARKPHLEQEPADGTPLGHFLALSIDDDMHARMLELWPGAVNPSTSQAVQTEPDDGCRRRG